MRLGTVILPEHRWPEARQVWERAEQLGFDHAWTYDHIAWRLLRDSPWFGAIPTLTAAAAVTDRMRLGTLVASPNFRHPVPFARDLIAVDDISGGRLTLGVGAGGMSWDATVLGQEPWSLSERLGRFGEFVELTDLLLTQGVTTYDGRYYSASDCPMQPGSVQQPRLPFAIAATGDRGMRVAARHGQTWVTNGDLVRDVPLLPGPDGAKLVREQMHRLDELCRAVGRDPGSLARLVLADLRLDGGMSSVEEFRDTLGHYQEIGVTDFVVHWPRPTEPFRGDPAAFEDIISTVTR